MTEADIHIEMAAISMTVRALILRNGRKRPTVAHHEEAQLLNQRHAELAKMLQKYQLNELKGKANGNG